VIGNGTWGGTTGTCFQVFSGTDGQVGIGPDEGAYCAVFQ